MTGENLRLCDFGHCRLSGEVAKRSESGWRSGNRLGDGRLADQKPAYKSGVRFRTIVHEDGTIERWQQPELPAWEVPKRDPHERRPRAPEWEMETAAAEIAGPLAVESAPQSPSTGATP
jgi:hypothetical protein